MINFGRMILFAALALISVYTISFAGWTWKKKNRLGALMVFLLALAILFLPVYVIFTEG